MKIAISMGDINGVGLEIALLAHDEIKQFCHPIYCIDKATLTWGAAMLGLDIPEGFDTEPCSEPCDITPKVPTAMSGKHSYESFIKAIELARSSNVNAIVTLPINKEAWLKANIPYKGHTDALNYLLGENSMMMLGCEKLFTALYTHHIPLTDVPKQIKTKKLKNFLLKFYNEVKEPKIGVLGLNPHAGDGGVIGDEEKKIKKAINGANNKLGNPIFVGPLVPDTAFIKNNLKDMQYFVCMYHDQGLIPLKSLYFEDSVNVTLGLNIIRTSVGHGAAYDIAYSDTKPSLVSYINAIKEAIRLCEKKKTLIL